MSAAFDVKLAGASPEAIRRHYDLGNDFFRLWLGPTMSYSCALFSDQTETLEAAQQAKMDLHLRQARAAGARRLLDVGSGWGSLLLRAVESHGVVRATGLTLSPRQKDWVDALGTPGVEVRLESWADHTPEEHYDAITSICAIEAFTRRGLTRAEKVEVYRRFFARCHQWLNPGGWLSLQCITYGNSNPEDFSDFIAAEIFPETDLPRLAELADGFDGWFEVGELRNDRAHYVRTIEQWSHRLRRSRPEAVSLVGEDAVVRFQRYLKLSAYMFMQGACDLIRVSLRRIDQPRGRKRG
jgi:cyclopropane-fatty-acyl-phospholipid synthase